MSLLNGFDANDVEGNFGEDFEPLPEGIYSALITSAREKVNGKNTGMVLVLEFTVLDEEYRNRKLWTNLNLDNPSPTAVAIARKEAKAITLAVGVPQPKSNDDLCNIPMKIRLAIEEEKGKKRNRIKAYYPINANPEADEPAAAAPVKKAAPAVQPWKRSAT